MIVAVVIAIYATGFEPVLVEVSKFSLSGLICNCHCDLHVLEWTLVEQPLRKGKAGGSQYKLLKY